MTFLSFSSFTEFNVYLTFAMIGMSIMMVVSAVTAAPSFVESYYKYATGNPDAEVEKMFFWKNVNTFYNVGTYVTQLLMELFVLAPFFRRVPLRLRMYVGLILPFSELLLLVIVPAVKIPTQNGAIAVMMVVSILGGFSKAVCDSTVNALVGPFPTKFMNGEQWGLTVSSLFMSVLQCILKAAMGTSFQDVLTLSRIYFGIAMGFQLLTILQFHLLFRNPYAHKFIAEFRVKNGKVMDELQDTEPMQGEAINDVQVLELTADGQAITTPPEIAVDDSQVRSIKEDPSIYDGNAAVLRAPGNADMLRDRDQVGNITSGDQMAATSALAVLKKVWPLCLCCFFVYFVSMTLWPGVLFKVDTASNWFGTIIVLLFCLFDCLSRIILMAPVLRPSPKACIAGALARLGVIPLLALSVRHTIKGQWMAYIIASIIGLTNGYFGTMSMILCSRTTSLSTAGERSIAAILCGIFLQFGLAAGSNLALAINLLLPKS